MWNLETESIWRERPIYKSRHQQPVSSSSFHHGSNLQNGGRWHGGDHKVGGQGFVLSPFNVPAHGSKSKLLSISLFLSPSKIYSII
jgi:hypothetical protein